MFHQEQLPRPQERYKNEIKRITGVLERHLQDRPYLVGDRITHADIAFIPWQMKISMIVIDGAFRPEGDFPTVNAWVKRVTDRPATAKIVQERAELVRKLMVVNETLRPARRRRICAVIFGPEQTPST
jgi:glutathione S-transferase